MQQTTNHRNRRTTSQHGPPSDTDGRTGLKDPRTANTGSSQREDGGPSDALSKLNRCEQTIEQYKESELQAARAMRRISKEGLHRELGFIRIGEYAKEKFGISKQRWYQLVAYAEIHDKIDGQIESTQVDVPLPESESHVRPLSDYKDDPDILFGMWKAVVERCDSLTRKNVKAAVDTLTGGSNSSNEDGSEEESHGEDADSNRDKENDSEKENSDEDDGSEENSDGSDSCDDSSKSSELEKARSHYSPVLDGLTNGVAESLLEIAETVSSSGPLQKSHLEDVRARHEKLSRAPTDASSFPCISGTKGNVNDRDVLIAIPEEMLTRKMAKVAVPIGVPQAQNEFGIPVSFFDKKPPLQDIRSCYEERERTPTFNGANEQIDWADYTINPVTGCLHSCGYCYARYLSEEMGRYKQGFHPTFYPGRLLAFSEAQPPEEIDHVREKNVFVGSMSDIFGKWVPDWIIQAILDEAEANAEFNYLFLTKFPQKLSRFDFPDNAWIGTTVDKQHRVGLAERYFQKVDASIKWLSCEPMLEELEFNDLSTFDCVVIGAQEGYGDITEKQPEFEWVLNLCRVAQEADCEIYFKENIDLNLPKDLPAS
ncbi:hypothetical protein BSZ35_00240 [Salinibacter sp. 10B]|uniref:DUF5131 family protein n=1 Tax=Salinibacter sp. 10B TaxID=1923971 RepID=UPI000D2AFAEB|nr:DUF5131 family protein [Salinibacter sp. 10B]PQJ36818.1 hypothetical protein BSZ35_00240 [Salinibacter sp. 10B]